MRADTQPEGWQATTLGDVARYINGFAFKPHHWKEHGLPIIRIAQMQDPKAACDYYPGPVPDHHQIDSGDLLFSWSATLLALIWSRGPALVNQHIFKVIPNDGHDLRFVHHLLNFSIPGLLGQSHGTTMKHVKRSDLLPYPAVVPLIAEQRRIAAILDTIDEAIRRTEQVIAKLQQMKQGLLHDLLTRGIDENGELRDPETFKESPLGRIPVEWDISPLEELVDVLDHIRVPVNSDDRAKRLGDVPYYGANGQQGWIDQSLFDEPLILLAEDGGNFDEFATRAIAYRIDGPSWVNNHAHIVRAKPDVEQDFVFWSLVHKDIRRYIAGGTRSKLTQVELRAIEMVTPPLPEQLRIAEALDQSQDRVAKEESVADKLRSLKQGLTEDLLTGRVRTQPS